MKVAEGTPSVGEYVVITDTNGKDIWYVQAWVKYTLLRSEVYERHPCWPNLYKRVK
jgi:hypothetical protein